MNLENKRIQRTYVNRFDDRNDYLGGLKNYCLAVSLVKYLICAVKILILRLFRLNLRFLVRLKIVNLIQLK
jgi:hypothetical protein